MKTFGTSIYTLALKEKGESCYSAQFSVSHSTTGGAA